MQYISTRNSSISRQFSDILLSGTSPDGGLYMPLNLPKITEEIMEKWSKLGYTQLATEIIALFCPEISKNVIQKCCEAAYVNFPENPAPICELNENLSLLELYHGPTLSFKDFAMQFLGQIVEHCLSVKNEKKLIITATSGDTGSAAIHAFKGSKFVKICILHPYEKISDFQRVQMTSVISDNVKNIAIHGTFDDCQTLVKGAFTSSEITEKFNLMTVNSINWGRITAQIVYYFYTYFQCGNRELNFAVPTGNFGNILSGFIAKLMGIKANFTIAVNENDTLLRFYNTGRFEPKKIIPTTSNAIDIANPSNFERLIWLLCDDKQDVQNYMNNLAESGNFTVSTRVLEKFRTHFTVFGTSMENCAKTQVEIEKKYNKIIDPHTAVALFPFLSRNSGKNIAFSTADPIKFDKNAKFPATQEKYSIMHADLHEVTQNILNW